VKPRWSCCVIDCSGRSDGNIKRPKIVVTANALFLFASFSLRIIFFMGESRWNTESAWHAGGPRGVKGGRNFARRFRDAVTEVSISLKRR